MPITDERIEAVEVDINDVTLADGVEQEFDAKEDWQAKAAPPPMGRYRLKVFLGGAKPEAFEQGTKQGFDKADPNGKYYTKQLSLKIDQPDGKWNNSILDYKVSTGVPRGKKISSMAGLLAMMGAKIPTKITDKALSSLLFRVLTKYSDGSLILVADCDWDCWDANDRDNLKRLKKGMVNFKDGKGGYNHIVKNSKGEECYAKLKVVNFLGKPDSAAVKASAASKVEGPKPVAAKPKPKVEEVVEEAQSDLTFAEDGEVVLDI